ncbi:PREDICTED: transmembrane protein 229A-like [Branchiostoma belcheri]|uniref:Transmembrane protein 229A-like n=1 Tax=Branchiostoma belcheri TaxID=7741 RepID=A0A6P4Z090_BRABE|nr:PREDICTED: transmembrane protein 229A-like [Branchiostoma belcheri]
MVRKWAAELKFPLPLWSRAYFYGAHGVLNEVVFTALFNLVTTGGLRLYGTTSLWMFISYGLCGTFVTEKIFAELYTRRRNIPVYLRACCYVPAVYAWELLSGLLLRTFNACPWDYSDYRYHFLGLVTLEYLPLWYMLGLYQDHLFRYLLCIQKKPGPTVGGEAGSTKSSADKSIIESSDVNKLAAGEEPLPPWIRFCFYGMHGFLDEVVFTMLYDCVTKAPDARLTGYTSIWSFLIYGSCRIMVERLGYVYLYLQCGVPTRYRVALYLVIAYTWEFVAGLILRQFGACSWDYSHYRFNVMGLITLEYAPGWLILGLYQDVMASYLLSLRVRKEKCVSID